MWLEYRRFVGIRADECTTRNALCRLHTAKHIHIAGRPDQCAARISHMDATHYEGRTLHSRSHGQTAGQTVARAGSQQGDASQIDGIHARIEQGRIVLTFDAKVRDGSPVRSATVHIAKEVLVLHIQVFQQMASTVKLSHKRMARVVADALQLPVLEVEVAVEHHLEVQAEVVVIEGEGSFQVVALVTRSLVGIGGIVMVIEDIAQFLGLVLRNPLRVELAIGERPAIFLRLANDHSAHVGFLVTFHQAVEATRARGCRTVDQVDELQELLVRIDVEDGVVVARAGRQAGFVDGILPPAIILRCRNGSICGLIVALDFRLVLRFPREVVVHDQIAGIVAIAHAEGIADACLHFQSVGEHLDGFAIGSQYHAVVLFALDNIVEGEDMVLPLILVAALHVATIDIIHIDTEAGTGGQHKHFAHIGGLTQVVGNGDKILPTIAPAEERPLAVSHYLFARTLTKLEERRVGLLLQVANFRIAQSFPHTILDAHERTRTNIHAGRHAHVLIYFRNGIAFQSCLLIALRGLGGCVVVVGDVGIIGILIVLPRIGPFFAIRAYTRAEFHLVKSITALPNHKSNTAALMLEHQWNTFRRARGIHPVSDAVVGIERIA